MIIDDCSVNSALKSSGSAEEVKTGEYEDGILPLLFFLFPPMMDDCLYYYIIFFFIIHYCNKKRT